MRLALTVFALIFFVTCGGSQSRAALSPLGDGGAPVPRLSLTILLAHNSVAEVETRHQLLRLFEQNALSPWLFTNVVLIDEEAIPHSHPRLTLHTRHLKGDDQLLSTFIHEQMHWFLEAHPIETAAATDELRVAFPMVPVGFPEGAHSERSSYEHLIVILLEYEGLTQCVGPNRADATFHLWEGDHYRGLYKLVRTHMATVKGIAARYGLLQPRSGISSDQVWKDRD